MSGHDIAAKPHKTTHELVQASAWEGCRGDCGGNAGQCPHTDGCLPLIAVQWVRWPNVVPREKPATERRQGPRSSRFGDLTQ